MALFSTPIRTADDLFLHTLQDIYYAENQIVKNLPAMAQKATSPELRSAFETHHRETQGQVQRLDQVFQLLQQSAKGVTCQAIDGILAEGKEIMTDCEDGQVRDAAMLAAAQAVEHYEIARYGTLAAMARQKGLNECVRLFEQTLEEEKATDKKLTDIAVARVNKMAAE
ncbi:MAG: ferritin-like domain-containing protein [Acidisphaera sp.]|nr:ferritin-like domain-containing protein [Acidisphaera sp.]MBV9812976.1 ferritin-like domain-containing protein [Acetobacteraceae bacterium]